MTAAPFMTTEQAVASGKVFGQRYNGRYHLPLLPGEKGVKSLKAGQVGWVPYGVQSATNLAGSISETRALGIWERERTQLGLALRPDLYERLVFLVRRAHHADGINFATDKLKDSKAGQKLQAELEKIHDEARAACGADAPGIEGTNRHDAWEARAVFGAQFGTPDINAQLDAVEELLERKRLRRVPGLQERVVRNTTLEAAGRFDDIVQALDGARWPDGQPIPAGALLMADLKTKRTPFFTLLEGRIQLTVYATAEWMLNGQLPVPEYVRGPKHHVHQQWGVLLHCPADGAAPKLIRINLVKGMVAALLARRVCEVRSDGKSVASFGESEWA